MSIVNVHIHVHVQLKPEIHYYLFTVRSRAIITVMYVHAMVERGRSAEQYLIVFQISWNEL